MALLDEGRTGKWNRVRRRVLERDHHRCNHCGARATDVDHIVPRVMGGGDDWGNLQSLCARCHKRKSRQDHLRIRATLQQYRVAASAPRISGTSRVSVLHSGAKTGRPSSGPPPPQEGVKGGDPLEKSGNPDHTVQGSPFA